MPHYAHSLEGQPPEQWETMQQHEDLVANYCRKFLTRIDPSLEPWGDLLGRWHDLGKYSKEFQSYIRAANGIESDGHVAESKGRVDHSTAAAQLAVQNFGDRGKLPAYLFAGHHSGLPDWDDGVSQKGLRQRLKRTVPNWERYAPDELKELEFPGLSISQSRPDDVQHAAFRVSFWMRMLFSTLVDADFLATESFMSPEKMLLRPPSGANLVPMLKTLEKHLSMLQRDAEDTEVNRNRELIGQQCNEKASEPPGLFSLCVPTGGGKTLASLRFALKHAIDHKLDRVINAVPFTSIIEQNAQVYRDLFSSLDGDLVLEHHSNLDPANETTTSRLQTENWDALLVVTTNVQLFESLFAAKTSRCRKLHRYANSVIILDEAQTLPVELLQATLMVIRELVDVYGCTIVLCSATQPALHARPGFEIGLRNIRPIIDDAKSLYDSMRRTKVEVSPQLTDASLADQLNNHDQMLCIVNTRSRAASIYESLVDDPDANFHLSTRMCAAHRKQTLDDIRQRLKDDLPCRVISTQLIEAGVDVDFPTVFRARCGLDSLAQAAGRCNREGKREIGRVVFFESETPPPVGFLRQTADTTSELLDQYEADLLAPEAIEAYFELHYWKKSDAWDRHKVLEPIGNQPNKLQFNFREVAERYRFIRDETRMLIVGWDETGAELIEQLKKSHAFVPREILRQLQQYSIQLREHEFGKLMQTGAIELINDHHVLAHDHLYDARLGMVLERVDGVLPFDSCFA